MKTATTYLTLFLLLLITSCENNHAQERTINHPVLKALLSAEIVKDAKIIKDLFSSKAILSFPDSPPFYTNETISSVYAWSWERNNTTSVHYKIDSIYKKGLRTTLLGTYIFSSSEGLDSLKYKMVYQNDKAKHQIDTLLFGTLVLNNDRLILPEPTGKYQVGLKNYSIEHDRKIGYQVWYPAQTISNPTYATYRSKKILDAVSNFQEWPSFMVSHLLLIRSNSIINAIPLNGEQFPLLFYNHGYGGFSSVYQTVFEDLASHGYIVVSLGHEYESTLQILNDSSIISYSPNNPFYSARQTELNGTRINQLQSVILNSDADNEITKAYRELIQLSSLHNESVNLWADDTKAALSDFLDNPLFKELIDPTQKGIFGHSVGGATAGELCSESNLFQAGINLDGFQFGNLINGSLHSPFLFISSNQEGNRFLRYSPFIKESNNITYHLYIKGFEHSTFTDLAFNLNNNRNAIQTQRKIIKSFFDKHLKGVQNRFPESFTNHNSIKIYSK